MINFHESGDFSGDSWIGIVITKSRNTKLRG